MKFDAKISTILNEIHCWKGFKKVGMKKKNGKMVNDCRKIKKKK
jgi:hypothetical protein